MLMVVPTRSMSSILMLKVCSLHKNHVLNPHVDGVLHQIHVQNPYLHGLLQQVLVLNPDVDGGALHTVSLHHYNLHIPLRVTLTN